jgi:hypothetical protein
MKKIYSFGLLLLLGVGCQKNIPDQIQNSEINLKINPTTNKQIPIQPPQTTQKIPGEIPTPIPSSPQTVDKFVVHLKNIESKEIIQSGKETKLTFHIDGKNNAPIEHVDRYGKGWGKLTFQKNDSNELLEATPEEIKITKTYNDISFFANFPQQGIYHLNLEFKYGQKIFSTPFTISVQ